MSVSASLPHRGASRSGRAVLQLLKPITWFAPMWAFACGVISAGQPLGGRWPVVVAGVALAGPLVTGMSQAANDWFDRHVDAINEPGRPIPSGRVPGRTGLWIAVGWTVVSLAVAAALGPIVLGAALLGLGAGLGLQRAAAAAEAQRLVGQHRLRRLLRGAALVHRRGDHGGALARAAGSCWWPRCTARAPTAS